MLVHLALEDQVGDQRRLQHDLDGGDAARAAFSRGIRRCEIRARMFSDRSISSCSRLLFREEVDDAVERLVGAVGVQRREQRWPVSANWMPYSIVSRSRISPIRMTSGAWRSVFFSAMCQLSVSTPTSRCVTTQRLVLVHVLDRVLDRDDVAAAVLVAVADHRRERRRLAGAGARRPRSPGRAWSSRPPSGPAAARAPRASGSWC
jgi:hypothetical protein